MSQAARTLAFVHGSQFSSPVLEEYSARLMQFLELPGYRFWAVSGGSEATESAIKLSRQYTPNAANRADSGSSHGGPAIMGRPWAVLRPRAWGPDVSCMPR